MNPKVDDYLNNTKWWQAELQNLRQIILECGLDEDLKWKSPCYSYKNTNILIIGEFKESCVLSFFKGVLLHDDKQLLQSPGENSQSVKLLSFTKNEDINALSALIKEYIYEAIEIEKAGLKVQRADNTQLELVDELTQKLDADLTLKQAFENLTPGRQRAYNIYFKAAKQSKTRHTRIEKYIPRILSGKGINDCVCGLSKRMPNCDGSHNNKQQNK